MEDCIARMEDQGSRYVNLESALGRGIIFLLPGSEQDSMWTKLIPKKGEKFNEVVQTLRDNGVSAAALPFEALRDKVVNWCLDSVVPNSTNPAFGTLSVSDSLDLYDPILFDATSEEHSMSPLVDWDGLVA
ncbi:hypothetical protein CBER1_11932 [Cercospora berteroae]|uniref:Uncharacterized protein n=1 Tax=Cercospora berteroae TaxID=357750 RepID=A0A2S6CM79_9PEZI|nr:hypothetical protein CBER1_11932 [Cercospora berteroae]